MILREHFTGHPLLKMAEDTCILKFETVPPRCDFYGDFHKTTPLEVAFKGHFAKQTPKMGQYARVLKSAKAPPKGDFKGVVFQILLYR